MIMLAEIITDGPVDGMGDKRLDGSYVRLFVKGDGQYGCHYRISRGQAETLIAELQGALASGCVTEV